MPVCGTSTARTVLTPVRWRSISIGEYESVAGETIVGVLMAPVDTYERPSGVKQTKRLGRLF
jgi:hypothetical protein